MAKKNNRVFHNFGLVSKDLARVIESAAARGDDTGDGTPDYYRELADTIVQLVLLWPGGAAGMLTTLLPCIEESPNKRKWFSLIKALKDRAEYDEVAAAELETFRRIIREIPGHGHDYDSLLLDAN